MSLRQVRAQAKIAEYESACRFFKKHGIGGVVALPILKAIWLTASLLRLLGYCGLAVLGREGARQDAYAYRHVLRSLILYGRQP